MNSSWRATCRSATQEFPNILSNRNVYYRVQNSPPLVPILSQIKEIHNTPSYLSKIHSNIVTCTPIARQRVGKQIPGSAPMD
jgi:hypothetical protein